MTVCSRITLCLFLIQNEHKPNLVIYFLETPMQLPSVAKNSASLFDFVSNIRRLHLWQTKKLHCKKAFLLISFSQRILFLYKNICTRNCNELFQTIRHYLPSYIGVFVDWGMILQMSKSVWFALFLQAVLILALRLALSCRNKHWIQDLASCRLN